MLFQLMNWIAREEGQDLAEYGLVIALVAIAAIVALTALGGSLNTILASVAGAI